MFIIFLAIDQVLFKGFGGCDLELFNKTFDEYYKHKSTYSKYIYSGILMDYARLQAGTHFFDKEALSNLERLIAHVKTKETRVGIVLSSGWREFFDTETLKKIFKQLHFAEYIIDKIYDKAAIHLDDKAGLDPYPHELTRGELIELWLKQHPETADKFLIINNMNCIFSGLKELFPEHFVHCGYLYREAEYNLSISLIDKLYSQNNAMPALAIENKVIPTVVRNFDNNRECNQLMSVVSMRVLFYTRTSFLKKKIEQSTPFKEKKEIKDLILEYEKDDSKSKEKYMQEIESKSTLTPAQANFLRNIETYGPALGDSAFCKKVEEAIEKSENSTKKEIIEARKKAIEHLRSRNQKKIEQLKTDPAPRVTSSGNTSHTTTTTNDAKTHINPVPPLTPRRQSR